MENKNDFNSLLNAMLSAYEQRGDKNVNEVVAESMKEMGASQTSIDKATEAAQIIDRIQAKVTSLAEAKEKGMTREDWIASQAYKMAGSDEEKAADILSEIEKAVNTRVEQEAEIALSDNTEKE